MVPALIWITLTQKQNKKCDFFRSTDLFYLFFFFVLETFKKKLSISVHTHTHFVLNFDCVFVYFILNYRQSAEIQLNTFYGRLFIEWFGAILFLFFWLFIISVFVICSSFGLVNIGPSTMMQLICWQFCIRFNAR